MRLLLGLILAQAAFCVEAAAAVPEPSIPEGSSARGPQPDNETEPWWSLQPLHAPDVPKPTGWAEAWARTPVDAFIAKELESRGVTASPEADRVALIRRLSFDLIGLPPAPERVRAFIQDRDPRAYENLVEELLASPRYGERWARHWLDVVHYGDSHGYDKESRAPTRGLIGITSSAPSTG